jgi:F-type H+-transporting ATPase subunit a
MIEAGCISSHSAMVMFAEIAPLGEAQDVHNHELPMAAPTLFRLGFLEVNNSMVVSYFLAAVLVIIAQVAMRRPQLVPSGLQNVVEWIVESLQGFLQGVLGAALARKTFWFFATIFIFILTANWLALLPGVGSIGTGYGEHWYNLKITEPWLRGINADVNMTLAMSLLFFGLWIVWTLQSNGVAGTVHHIFGAKGGQKGMIGLLFAAIFIFVGVIELVSISIRPIALTFRLYGNVYGGEQMIETLMAMVPALGWLIPLPVYFFELMVGFIQALVFCLLTAVFTAMICRHDESEHPAKGAH